MINLLFAFGVLCLVHSVRSQEIGQKEYTGWAKKVGHYVWSLTASAKYLQNASTNFHDIWNTSMLFYSEHIHLFRVPQIDHTK